MEPGDRNVPNGQAGKWLPCNTAIYPYSHGYSVSTIIPQFGHLIRNPPMTMLPAPSITHYTNSRVQYRHSHPESAYNIMNNPTSQQQSLVLSILAADQPGLVRDFSRAIVEAGCNVIHSHMLALGSEFSMTLMVQGNWSSIAKLETLLPVLRKRLNLDIIVRRTGELSPDSAGRPYLVEVVSLDTPGIIHQLSSFFASHDINIQDMQTDSYLAAHGQTQMLSLSLTVNLPVSTQIAQLRDEFLDFCDNLNLDAVLEPIKG